MSSTFDSPASRRQFMKTTAVAAAATLVPGITSPLFAAEKDPYAGFRMGIQSYSLRGFDVTKALETTDKLGLHYWEAYPNHIPVSTVPAQVAKYKKMLDGANVKLIAFGVLPFSKDETQARAFFDFAKAIGVETLSANPEKNKATFDLLDKLVEEYAINIAIHNHGPGAKYDKIDDVVDIVKGRNPRVGACVDTGHFLRSNEDPVEAIDRLSDRLYGVHLKDVKDAKIMTILGEGDLDVVGCLKLLKKNDYQHSLAVEYEENPDNPVSDIEVCLSNVRKAVKQIG